MKNLYFALVIVIILVSCTKESKGSMLVTGEVIGLKKGTLYLQKMKDTLLVAVDSVTLDGVSTFSLSDALESPEIYYLTLDNIKEKQLAFFGDKGTITINTKLDKFIFAASIKGLKNQELLEQYNEMMRKFKNKNLDLIKAEFDTKEDSLKTDSIRKVSNNLIKRRYYYTTNFAVNNSDAEIAPYLALTELYNANLTLLDTINNSLTKDVKASKYGKKLEAYITEIKSKE